MQEITDSEPPASRGEFGTSKLGVSSGMMEESPRYGAWIAAALSSHLRGELLELGCGQGNYTAHYLELDSVKRILAMDLDAESIAAARRRVGSDSVRFEQGAAEDLPEQAFDSIVCANVAEHVEHEVPFLESLYRALRDGGTLALLVPAHPRLYSRYDYEAGHYRRYTKTMLRDSLRATPFRIERLFYFNALGALGWFYAFKLSQRREVRENDSRTLIRLFDRFVLPVGRSVEGLISPPFGLSLVALCRRPASTTKARG